MPKEIYLNPATGAPEFDEFGDFIMTGGPETSLYLAITTELDSLFGAPDVGSRFPALISGVPPADRVAELEAATALALRPLQDQGLIDVEQVRIDGHRITMEARQLTAPFVLEIKP